MSNIVVRHAATPNSVLYSVAAPAVFSQLTFDARDIGLADARPVSIDPFPLGGGQGQVYSVPGNGRVFFVDGIPENSVGADGDYAVPTAGDGPSYKKAAGQWAQFAGQPDSLNLGGLSVDGFKVILDTSRVAINTPLTLTAALAFQFTGPLTVH